jgi:acyl transferase domain-containing protein
VGPGRTLATLARQHPGKGDQHAVVNTLPHPSDGTSELTSLLTAAGRLWLTGVPISWPQLYDGQRRGKVRLPTYAFQRQRYLVEPLDRKPQPRQEVVEAHTGAAAETAALFQPNGAAETLDDDAQTEVQRTLKSIFAQVLGVRHLTLNDSFFDLGGDSLIAAQLVSLACREFPVELPARALFQAPTVAELAAFIEAQLGDQHEEVHSVLKSQ